MVFWCRIKQKKLISFSNQFKRCYFHVPRRCLANHTVSSTRIWVLENPTSIIRKTQFEFANNARFFAAPVQAKPKQEQRDTSGPRLNDKIKAEFVRLVTEEGHCVVSRREALERARCLHLDLVEVQRNAKPPVCKIMDYHKEKYKQQVKDKDHCKSKSEVTLRKGDCKEVRFFGKTEQKDLQMKADMVKRLMERGYRVKCMAMGTEDQDLGALLSRLSSLIEDVSLVECGPRVEKKQAFVIVRHVKFGPPKKGLAKKPSQVVGFASPEVQTVATSPLMVNPSMLNQSPIQFEETENIESEEDEIHSDEADTLVPSSMKMPDKDIRKKVSTWSVFDANDDLNSVFDFGDEAKVAKCSGDVQMNSAPEKIPSATNNFSDFVCPRPVDSSRSENGYRMEPRNNYPPAKSMDGKGTSARNSSRLQPQFLKQDRQPQFDLDISQSARETKRIETPSSSAPSYGIFSAPKVGDSPESNGLPAEANRYSKRNTFDSTRHPRPRGVSANLHSPSSNADRGGRTGADNGGQGKWGILGRESSNVIPSRNSESQAKFQR
ncbi:translation initiation factor IF3-1, mitochondrial-like isoform X2 [Actinidia eriantha]|uniref:translation initiation factor IF3-1, mitochondrial-like isoform X2 n=1 Tax=Actinidia eriantha TaxID=165200 RepID=UPI002584974D|nr:translation initiation factor IF3-1, mitochondrial-like isoform X2 [Actinidia eriantha]